MPDKAWQDAMAEVEGMIEDGEQPSEVILSIQSYDECSALLELIGGGSNGSPEGGVSSIWEALEDPNTVNYWSIFSAGSVILPDTFQTTGLASWPTSVKITLNIKSQSSFCQYTGCELRSDDNVLIAAQAVDVVLTNDNAAHLVEIDLIPETETAADLSFCDLKLRFQGTNPSLEIYGATVEVTYDCDGGDCENNLELRPVSGGYLGTVVGTGTRAEIMAGNDFTPTSYSNYIQWDELVGSEVHNPGDGYHLGPIDSWPSYVQVRLRLEELTFSVACGVVAIYFTDANANVIAQWGGEGAFEWVDVLATHTFTLSVQEYTPFIQEFGDLSDTILTVVYNLSSGVNNTADLRVYALAVDIVQECPDLIVGAGGVLGGGVSTNGITYRPTLSGGMELDGGAMVLAGLIGNGGAGLGGASAVISTYTQPVSGGLEIGPFPYRYRRSITVPAGKVTEDQYQFPLGIVATLDSTKVGDGGFLFTTPTLQPLPFEVREWSYGRLTAYVKTPLSTASDTTIYLYYGEDS